MSKTTKLIVLALSFILATFVIAGGLGVRASSTTEDSYKQLGVYSEVLSRIRTEYVEEPNVPKVTNGALHGLLESLDANSSYLDPQEYKDYKQRKNEGKASIGAARRAAWLRSQYLRRAPAQGAAHQDPHYPRHRQRSSGDGENAR